MNLYKILYQGLGYTAANWVGIIITFCITAYITRLIGPEARGVYAWAIGILALMSQLGLLGLDTVLRFRAARMAGVGPLFKLSGHAAWLVGGIIVLGTIAGTSLIPYAPEAQTALLLAMLPLPLWLGTATFSAIFQGSRNVRALIATTIGQKVAMAVVLLGLTFTPWVGVNGILWATTLAMMLAFGQYMFYAVRQSGCFWSAPTVWKDVLRDWKLGITSYTADLLTVFLMRCPLLVAFAHLGAAVTGYLSIAIMLVDLMLIIPGALSAILAPHTVVSNLSARQTNAQIWRFHLLTLLALVGVAAVAWVCAPFAIVLVYGEAFRPSVDMFRLLLGYFLAMGSFRLTQQLLVNHVRPRWLVVPPGVGGAVFGVGIGVWGVAHVEGLICAITAAALAMAWSAGIIFAAQGVMTPQKLIKKKVDER